MKHNSTRYAVALTGMLLLVGGMAAGCREERAESVLRAPAPSQEPVVSIVMWSSVGNDHGYVDLDEKVSSEIARLLDEASAAEEGWLYDDSFTRRAVSGQLYLQRDGVVRQFVMSETTLFLVEEKRWRHWGGPLIERLMVAYRAGRRAEKPDKRRPEWMAQADAVVQALGAAGIPGKIREGGIDLAAPWTVSADEDAEANKD